jgi:uncharacterized protein YerC
MSRMDRRGKFKSDTFRARVRQMLGNGYSQARIAKETGKSLTYVSLIVRQERGAK